MSKKIFASLERQRILNELGIKWKFDQDLNFVFDNKYDEGRAVKALKTSLML